MGLSSQGGCCNGISTVMVPGLCSPSRRQANGQAAVYSRMRKEDSGGTCSRRKAEARLAGRGRGLHSMEWGKTWARQPSKHWLRGPVGRAPCSSVFTHTNLLNPYEYPKGRFLLNPSCRIVLSHRMTANWAEATCWNTDDSSYPAVETGLLGESLLPARSLQGSWEGWCQVEGSA